MSPFQDRSEAGRLLARRLMAYAGQPDVLVLGLPRGGVPVTYEVARAIGAPLDVCVVRKLGVPGREELAMGAIASGGAWTLNEDVIAALNVPGRSLREVAEREFRELKRREEAYRGDRPVLDVHRWTVILVDDGIATGSTMRAAAAALRRLGPVRLVIAAPTASPSAVAALAPVVDEVACVIEPGPFWAVGAWYADFSPISDEKVRDLLEKAALEPSASRTA
jgi:predicted phosphoribosyltransferase